jgi:hypothetical protein
VVKLTGARPSLIGADLTLMPSGMTGGTTTFDGLSFGTAPSCAGLAVPTARFEPLTTSVGRLILGAGPEWPAKGNRDAATTAAKAPALLSTSRPPNGTAAYSPQIL